jgi:uncharacterized membrane protein
MTQSESAGSDGALGKRRERFNRWRRGRPFAGGALLILASFVIAWIPIHIAPDTILIGAAISPTLGLLFAALVFLCGVFALTRPGHADIFGIFGGLFSLFSLYGALGGLFVGLVLGLIGANLCYAWKDEDEEESDDGSGGTDTTDEGSDFDFGEDSSEEDSGGLLGSRSVGRAADSSGSQTKASGAGGRTASIALLVVTIVGLSVFAQPFLGAAAQPYPEQTRIDGTIVIAQQFSGQRFSHANVTTDTSNLESVSAARLSFSSANIQGLTMYKNFRSGPQTPFHLTIKGSSASAPKGLSLTVSEFYATELSLAGVVPLARNKWTTCPGQDFLLRVGDLGPLPGPPIDGRGVTTNTHRLRAPSITIKNLNLTVGRGVKSTSVTGTPECTRNPIEPVLGLFRASALELLAEEGQLPRTVLTNGTITGLSAPAEVNQSETFNVNATITNTGYINDTKTVEYRFSNETRLTRNVTLERNGSTTISFTDTANVSEGTYSYGIFTQNGSATGSITVVNQTNSGNVSTTTANNTTTNATDTAGSASTAANQTTPNTSDASAGAASTQATASQTPTDRNTTTRSNTNGGSETTMTATTGTNGTSTTPQASDASVTRTTGNGNSSATTGNANGAATNGNGGATNSNSGGATDGNSGSATAPTGESVAAQSVPQSSRSSSTTSTNSGETTTVTRTPTATASPTPTPTPVVRSSSMSDLSGPDRVKQGENFTVSATMKNTGNKKGMTIPVSYGSPSGDSQTKEVTLDPGQTKTVTFKDTMPSNKSGGSYKYTVSTNTSSKTGSLTVPPFNTNTKVSALSGPDGEVKQDGKFTVTAKVTNTGNKKGLTLPVTYGSLSGDNQTTEVTLNPDQTKTVTFTDTVPSDMNQGNYEYNISTNTSEKTGSVAVPPFNTNTTVSDLTGPSDEVKQGESFDVSAKVTNTGNKEKLEINVTYGSPGGDNKSKNVTLDSGETQKVKFKDNTVPSNMSGGSYEYNISTNTSSKTESLTVPPFNTNTKVTEVSRDIEEIAPGESFDVKATVKNTGNKYGLTLPVTYETGGEVKKSQDVTLNPGNNTTVTFSDITVPGDKIGGSYKYTVSTNESTVPKSISVVNETNASGNANNTTENATDTAESQTTLQSLFASVFP